MRIGGGGGLGFAGSGHEFRQALLGEIERKRIEVKWTGSQVTANDRLLQRHLSLG
jgi:hypothetical protein